MATRSKPYTVGPDWTPLQGEHLNEMLEILFTDTSGVDAKTGLASLALIPGALSGKIILSAGAAVPPIWSPFFVVIGIDPAVANMNIGQELLPVYTTGTNNCFIGLHAGTLVTSGVGNLGIGHSALASLTTGINNLAIGWDSQIVNVTGNNNLSVGEDALKFCTGSNNVGIGFGGGLGITTGLHNFGLGIGTLNAAAGASYNVALGEIALNNLIGVNDNVGLGYAALQFDVSGAQNTAVGNYAGNHLLGTGNVCVGYAAGYYETGANQLFIDNATRASAADAYVKALIYGVFASTPGAQTLAFNAVVTGNQPGIATTSTDGHVLANATLATAGVPVQQSPRLRFRSHVWKTGAAVDNTDDWWIESVPVSAATPSGLIQVGKSLNGGATTVPLTLDSAGNTTILGYLFTGSNVYIPAGNAFVFNGRSMLTSTTDGELNITNNGITSGIGFDVRVDGTLKVRNRAQNADGAVQCAALTQSGKTTTYNNIATVSNGLPSEYATIDTTGLTANVGVTTLYAVPASGAGLYRVSAYVVETTAGSLSSTLPNVQVVYTDNDTGGSITMDATPVLGVAGIGQTGALTANTVGTASSGVIAINVKASTTIQYQTVNYASNLGGMTYAIHLKLEAL